VEIACVEEDMKAFSLFVVTLLSSASLLAQAVPVRLIVTAEGSKGHETAGLTSKDIKISGNKHEFQVEDLIPLRGEHAALQLAVMIDDGSDANLGLQYDDLRRFIREQPASTQVGIYYIRNGSAQPYQSMTSDHEAAATHLRLPLGQPGIAVSPYLAISEFVKKWPAADASRREVLLISSGIDLDRESPPQNPYLAAAIADCQRAHVLVHSIYFASSGHGGHDYFLMNFGRDNLSYIGDETGGESYWQGLSTSVTLRPYFDDLNTRLKNQYLLTLTVPPEKKGRFERIHLQTEMHDVDLMAPDQAWVPADK
jgi:hypothetical protein